MIDFCEMNTFCQPYVTILDDTWCLLVDLNIFFQCLNQNLIIAFDNKFVAACLYYWLNSILQCSNLYNQYRIFLILRCSCLSNLIVQLGVMKSIGTEEYYGVIYHN